MQAETYHNRATSLIHSTSDRETLLAYKLCQARISDYARKFLEAASRYHELSFVGEIDEDERRYMLYVQPTLSSASHLHRRVVGRRRLPVLYSHRLAQTAPESYPPFVAMNVPPSSPPIASLPKCSWITYCAQSKLRSLKRRSSRIS